MTNTLLKLESTRSIMLTGPLPTSIPENSDSSTCFQHVHAAGCAYVELLTLPLPMGKDP